jgi:hypothetical protein
VVLPLLIAAELVVHRRMRTLLEQFLERHLIPENAIARFEVAIASAFRLRNSELAEVLLIAIVYRVGILVVWRHDGALDTATWYATPSAEGARLSLAGTWHRYVRLQIFQFLLVRWYIRLFIWVRFLWQVSRIALRLAPTHPDRVGGLGLLAKTVYALGENGRDVYVRQLRDVKISAILEGWDADILVAYGKLCAWAPARAHARRATAHTGKSSRSRRGTRCWPM